ncbi:hypothetical protein [Collimonas humicola]|uniref:hypothetical protein n=1 Tax=Collimonas humicola TaxID=2825886 RepID=UPI001B8D35AD|nr:hypothetical protein [Collimonas humicola]
MKRKPMGKSWATMGAAHSSMIEKTCVAQNCAVRSIFICTAIAVSRKIDGGYLSRFCYAAVTLQIALERANLLKYQTFPKPRSFIGSRLFVFASEACQQSGEIAGGGAAYHI